MEHRIPLPTDNIFKFYAMFGLLIFIFGLSAVIYTTKSANDFLSVAVVDLEELKSLPTPSVRESARRQILQRQIDIAIGDRKYFEWICIGLSTLGFFGMFYGFQKWHKEVQPKLDEISELQLQKLRHEVNQQKLPQRRRIAQ